MGEPIITPSSKATWDLNMLKKDIEADELHAHTAGENLGTKLDFVCDPKALTAKENNHSMGFAIMMTSMDLTQLCVL